ncbi:MAG TPA: ABC transporter substrate-binding protein [Acidimicrobiales bacterium]|nr:ABC transporter substrate-binding protein [Acidimicrobiales bacterium]
MRRKALALVILLGLLVAACGGGSDTDEGAGGQTTGQPDLNAEVRVAANEDQWTEGGTGAKSYHFMYVYNVQVYEPLIYLGSDYTLKPGLAERWELQADGKTWRFFLRRGVTFHDGTPFSADDVVWTWGVRQPEGKTLTTVLNTLGPDSVKKIDDFTVDFTPMTPNLRLPEQIVHPEGAIVKNGTHNDTPPYAGTGPWKYESYTPKQTASFVRNDNYWGEKPKVRKMSIRFYPDPQTRLEALKSGQADIAIDLPPDATDTLESDPNFKVVRSKPGRVHLLYVNKLDGRITQDPAVREAVSFSIDRDAYVDVVLDGNGEPGRWMAPESVLGSSASLVAPIPRDLTRARRVLDDAGWRVGSDGVRAKDGRRLSLKLLGQQEVSDQALVLIQSNLKDVGIDVEIKRTPDVATRNSLYAQGKGDFDLDLEPPNQNDGNPAFLPVLRMAARSATNVQFAPGAPPATPNGPAFEAEVVKSDQAKTPAEVQQAAATMMQILINKDYLVVPLAGAFRIYGMSKNVNLGDPHPSFTNQTWFSLTMSSGR